MQFGGYILDFAGGYLIGALIEATKELNYNLGVLLGTIMLLSDLIYYLRCGENFIDFLKEYLD